MYQLKIVQLPEKIEKLVEVSNKQCLHELLVNASGYHAPCGGNKVCKKCKVKIIEDVPYSEVEKQILTELEMKQHIHLACLTNIEQDLTVILEKQNTYQIAQNIYDEKNYVNPIVKRKIIKTDRFTKGLTTDLAAIIKHSVGVNEIALLALRKLPEILEKEVITVVYDAKAVLDLLPVAHEGYGVAIDIGTTTVVAYLYNLTTGDYKDHRAMLNKQQNYGYDVISRIQYADSKENLDRLGSTIINQINSMIEEMLGCNHLEQQNLDEIVIVGNTVMMHLLLKISPKTLGIAPFKCVFTQTISQKAHDLGLYGAKHCQVILMPHVAAYVGGDIISGIIATKLNESNKYRLLLDIGTNGEMVLAKGEAMYCCATAAGPAFEGAKIECGIGGIYGAINKVYDHENGIGYTTIGDAMPIGLCGSGIIDGVAYLLEQGLLDESGYLDLEEDYFVIAEKGDGSPIYISQKDIREIQLAKAAIRAGIETLLEESGVSAEEIDALYLAGGFGNYMSKESAIKIGLLPKVLEDKIITVGNAAGIGAIQLLLGSISTEQCDKAKEACEYIELSHSPIFTKYYIEQMVF